MFGFVQLMGCVQQRFGWDTSNVQACAAQCLAALNTGCFQPKLRCTDCGHISTWSTANYNQVIGCHRNSPVVFIASFWGDGQIV
jgi:hypothetical protein